MKPFPKAHGLKHDQPSFWEANKEVWRTLKASAKAAKLSPAFVHAVNLEGVNARAPNDVFFAQFFLGASLRDREQPPSIVSVTYSRSFRRNAPHVIELLGLNIPL